MSADIDTFGLPDHAIKQIADGLSWYPEIKQVTLFGSRAKGNFRPGFDIDLCLDAKTLSFANLLQIENQLDDLLLPWKIDLCLAHQIDNPALIAHIERVGLPFKG